MAKDKIIIKGARQHNLKGIDIQLPRDKFIVMTGLSGSGKSSLAFDTIYAEGREGTWNRCPLTPGSSLGRWTSRTSTI
jgi:excinuclease UvrABC ATPase subunit